MSPKKPISKKPIGREQLLNNFGARLKQLREKRKMSGEELGEMVGMNRQAISRLEVGGTNPSLEIISKLCWALNMKVETFFKGFK